MVDSSNVGSASVDLDGGETVRTEDLERRRRVAKLKRRGCGCDMSIVCKHYYQNNRPVVSGTERHTEGDTDSGAAATPPVQTFLDITGMDQVVTPRSSPRLFKLLRRRRQRLSTAISDKGSASGSRRETVTDRCPRLLPEAR